MTWRTPEDDAPSRDLRLVAVEPGWLPRGDALSAGDRGAFMNPLADPFTARDTTLPCLYWRHDACAGEVHRALMPSLLDRLLRRRPIEVVPCDCACHRGAPDHPSWVKPTA